MSFSTFLRKLHRFNALKIVMISLAAYFVAGFIANDQPVIPCKASINYHTRGNLTEFTGIYTNLLDEKVKGEYQMDLIREGRAGRSVSSQSGAFEAEAFQEVNLSSSSINIGEDDQYTIVLKILQKGEVICTDSIVAVKQEHPELQEDQQ